jgi:hypothetical protein
MPRRLLPAGSSLPPAPSPNPSPGCLLPHPLLPQFRPLARHLGSLLSLPVGFSGHDGAPRIRVRGHFHAAALASRQLYSLPLDSSYPERRPAEEKEGRSMGHGRSVDKPEPRVEGGPEDWRRPSRPSQPKDLRRPRRSRRSQPEDSLPSSK